MTEKERDIIFNLTKGLSFTNKSLALLAVKVYGDEIASDVLDGLSDSASSIEKILDLMMEEWSKT